MSLPDGMPKIMPAKAATSPAAGTQTKKGNPWHLGRKAYIGVGADSALVHTVPGTAANVNDVTPGQGLLNGEEQVVFAEAGYPGATQGPEATRVE